MSLSTVSTALKTPQNVFKSPPQFIPHPVAWDNFAKAWTALPFTTFVGNTLFITIVATTAQVLTGSLVAYGFARFQFRGRNALFYLMLSTMMLPKQVTMIPSFMIWRSVGLYNTLCPLWLPAWFGTAFFIFLMTQHMRTLPRELEEAAQIDGAGTFKIFTMVILPLARGAIATLAIFTFLNFWNEFTWPYLTINDASRMTLPVALIQFKGDYWSNYGQLMAGAAFSALPAIIVFLMAQRLIIRSITLTGIKG